MTESRPIQLSSYIAWIVKYTFPLMVVFVGIGRYHEKTQSPWDSLIMGIGLLYWGYRFIPLKEVKLDGNYLIISNDFKKDRIHLNDIDKLTTGGWSMYLTRIHFKEKTKFGQTIIFATAQSGFGAGISEGVKNILKQIQDNIERQKNQVEDNGHDRNEHQPIT